MHSDAVTFEAEEAANKCAEELFADQPELNAVPVAVKSGHWLDLKAGGLPVGDMGEEELRSTPALGMA